MVTTAIKLSCEMGHIILRRSLMGNLHTFSRCMGTYENVLLKKIGKQKNVGLITLNRPKYCNALSEQLIADLKDSIKECDGDDDIGCVILTGKGEAFAAGADIKQIQNKTFRECVNENFLAEGATLGGRKPVIAAVNGFALGGGCEIAMLCDIVYASEKALFGQLEILLGTIPAAGGTQRLPRIAGKSLAMELILTGDVITAHRALAAGLVSKVCKSEDLLDESLKTAEKISSNSKIIVSLAKETVDACFETSLFHGISLERKLAHSTFATGDRSEGMNAFIEKRKAKFSDS